MTNSRIFTVSEINASIRGLLEVQFPFVSIAGEISNLRKPVSGHCYFTLKDEQSQLRAVFFKMQQRYASSEPADGQMVICHGRISVYEPRGEYQLIIDTIDFHGTGVMQLEFERLKQKLAAEGLFTREAKRPLPFFPAHITLVTSPKGAAVHDFIRMARARCPQTKIAVFPVPVQGESAAGEIARAIEQINRLLPTEVIVLCRGGGSLEDLWAFNKEKVARAIHASAIPVVSAVGHEVDFTIADFTADLRAPTPSAAAEMILPDTRALHHQVALLQRRQQRLMEKQLLLLRERVERIRQRLLTIRHPLDHLAMKLDHVSNDFHRAYSLLLQTKLLSLDRAARRLRQYDPASRLEGRKQKLAELHRRLLRSIRSHLARREEGLQRSAALLDAVNPLATLARGYAIARTPYPEWRVITKNTQVQTGARIDVILHQGSLQCRVEKTSPEGLERKKKGEG